MLRFCHLPLYNVNMLMTNTPITQQLPSPILQSHVALIDSAMQPMVKDLTRIPSFISAALFVKDQLYQHEASTVSVVSAPNIHKNDVEFMDKALKKRRIDLSSTAAGHTFLTHQSELTASRMNPGHHVTWGVYAEPTPGHASVLQLAFDRKKASSLNEDTIAATIRPHLSKIWAIAGLLTDEAIKKESLADELMMDIPATPNAYVVKWDSVHSTKMVASNYALYRHYLKQFMRTTIRLTEAYGGEVTSHQGDSQDIVIPLADTVDKANLHQVGVFGRDTVLPLVRDITTTHNTIAAHYPTLAPKIRIGVGLGYIEQLHAMQTTGPVFWELASALKTNGNNEPTFNAAAKIVLDF